MSKNDICLIAENIRLSFGLRTVLDIDRFSISDGDRIGLVGENGAGKTTLLRVLTGEILPDAGSVQTFVPFGYIRQMDSESDKVEVAQTKIAGELNAKADNGSLSGAKAV